jgi:hypothetical protein
MEHEPIIDLFDSRFQIFGTMDGFSLVKWVVKVENTSYVDVYLRLSLDFLDQRGEKIIASKKWQWFCSVYSQKHHTPMDRGCCYLLKGGTVKEISGIVKTTANEAGRFADIDFRIDRVMQIQKEVSDKTVY